MESVPSMTLKNETKSDVDVRNLMSRNVKKRTFRHVRPVKIHSRILIRIFTGRISDSQWCNNADSEDSDQTARMRRLIWVFVGRTYQKVRFLSLRFWYILKPEVGIRNLEEESTTFASDIYLCI